MDAARDRSTLEIVEAEDLKLLEHVDTYGYVCHGYGCGVQVFPRSFRPENLVRAHFQLKSPHEPGCDVKGEDAIVSRGAKGSVQQELETSPGLSPARLHLVETRRVINPELAPTDRQTQIIGRAVSTGISTERPVGRRPANSIRPICRAFLLFSYNRHLSLHIDGIDTTTYQTVFKKLRSNGFERFLQQRIFYAELAWQAVEECAEHLIIHLNAGEWHASRLTPYCVVVQWGEWSNTARSRLRHELEAARQESMAAKKRKDAKRTYLLFIGPQDAEALSQFIVNDPRLICTVHGELVFPPRD
jgi:hypothetical protein